MVPENRIKFPAPHKTIAYAFHTTTFFSIRYIVFCMGGPVRVGLCRDSAHWNFAPMRGLGGAEMGEHFSRIIL